MTNETILAIKKNRLKVLEERGDKNVKCSGTVKKLRREIRNLEAKLS